MARVVSATAAPARPVALKATDASALKAMAQAAVNVELFTIPLYMGTLYSIQGTHQITGNNDFYKGRRWPGPAPTATPTTANEQAFNIIFSVFVEEMLHLQLAANIAAAIGVNPCFTSPVLQRPDHSWICYGPDLTVIPHIVDLRDTTDYTDVKVAIGAVSHEQVRLFLAIEQPEAQAQAGIPPEVMEAKYHPTVPFAGWTPDKTEVDLPMFGTIGWMYQCYFDYMNLTYEDGTTLWDCVFPLVQNDMFNETTSGHPGREYPGFETTLTDPDLAQAAFDNAVAMLDAITDQGEGSVLETSRSDLLMAVDATYQASKIALQKDYPDYDEDGTKVPPPNSSAQAAARTDHGAQDHYERFQELAGMVDQVETWPAWFARVGQWTAADLQTDTYDPSVNPYGLPTTAEVAAALNHLGHPESTPGPQDFPSRDANYTLLSQASVGAIAGITTVLDSYWAQRGVAFPYPSMVGSGDRMAICWAVFGLPPDLSQGIGSVAPNTLPNSCQGLDYLSPGNNCAPVEIFHACRGSNTCRARGGCGFVQPTTGGGQCGSTDLQAKNLCGGGGGGDLFSAPADNKCGGFGGCATPISASQIFPAFRDSAGKVETEGTMAVFDFPGPPYHSQQVGTLPFKQGDKVHDIAYAAFLDVLSKRTPPPTVPADPPPPNTLRLVFPPST